MKMRKAVYLSLLLLFIPIAALADSNPPDMELKFGILQETNDGFVLVEETNIIPLTLDDDGFVFGFTLNSNSNKQFEAYCVIRLPGEPNVVGGKIAQSQQGGEVLITEKETHPGTWTAPVYFDKGDPLGEWGIDLFVNGSLFKTIQFSVVAVL